MKRIGFVLLLMVLPFELFAQQDVVGKVITQNKGKEEIVPGAVVLLYAATDTVKHLKVCITDTLGRYELKDLSKGDYLLRVSCMGYCPFKYKFRINTLKKGAHTLHEFILKEDTVWIKEIKISAQRKMRSIDHLSMTFTKEQIKKAYNARDLMLNLPHLHINRMTNGLAAIDGKSITILINGVLASNQELRMIPADKIKKVDYYDVPPIRYASAGKVLSVITRTLDTGWSGDLYVNATDFFTLFTSCFSYIHDRKKFSIGYDLHLNNKWNQKKDFYHEKYNYTLLDKEYNYDYVRQEKSWGTQQGIHFDYTYLGDNYVFQVKPKIVFTTNRENDEKQIDFQVNNQKDSKEGGLQNRIETISPSLDLYFSKKIDKKQHLDFNLLTIVYRNNQHTDAWEKGIYAFKDNIHLKSTKISMIGEIAYELKKEKNTFSAGYKTKWSFLNNELMSNQQQDDRFEVRTQQHYGYLEWSGAYQCFMYRLSLGANMIVHANDEARHTQYLFSPMALFAYRINARQQLRLRYESCPIRPSIQQMSNQELHVMNQLVRRGNPDLKSALYHDLQLMYHLNIKRADWGMSIFYTNVNKSLFNNYIKEDTKVVLTNMNAKQDATLGFSADLSLRPIKGLTLGISVRAVHRWFKVQEGQSVYKHWFFPVNLYFNYRYKRFSFDYYQKLKSDYLEGIYVKGIEKVSYFNLSYRLKAWSFALNAYFPFGKNDFINHTIVNSPLNHRLMGRLKRKEKTWGITVAYCFNTAKKKYKTSRRLYNKEEDTGAFKVK